MHMLSGKELIRAYDLLPHPEGGWYRETYKSNELILQNALPARFSGDRAFATAIFFLLEKNNFSAFHKIKSDECWHFYAGSCLLIYIIYFNGNLEVIKLGNDISKGETFQYVVPAGCWFASKPIKENNYSFVGCTVSPGFDFNDFTLANAETLLKEYPQHADIINALCH